MLSKDMLKLYKSSSAWRMWIEIHYISAKLLEQAVSSSAWRMWIEMIRNNTTPYPEVVILRMEDVD